MRCVAVVGAARQNWAWLNACFKPALGARFRLCPPEEVSADAVRAAIASAAGGE